MKKESLFKNYYTFIWIPNLIVFFTCQIWQLKLWNIPLPIVLSCCFPKLCFSDLETKEMQDSVLHSKSGLVSLSVGCSTMVRGPPFIDLSALFSGIKYLCIWNPPKSITHTAIQNVFILNFFRTLACHPMSSSLAHVGMWLLTLNAWCCNSAGSALNSRDGGRDTAISIQDICNFGGFFCHHQSLRNFVYVLFSFPKMEMLWYELLYLYVLGREPNINLLTLLFLTFIFNPAESRCSFKLTAEFLTLTNVSYCYTSPSPSFSFFFLLFLFFLLCLLCLPALGHAWTLPSCKF